MAEMAEASGPRLPEITHVAGSASIDDVVTVLRRDGAVIVEDMLPEPVFQELLADLRVLLDVSPVGKAGQLGEYTRRCGGLMAKSVHTAELLTHPILLGVSERFLVTDQPYVFWNNQVERRLYAKLQLSIAHALEILPGERAQPLHRDDAVHHRKHPGPETQVILVYACADFTENNGATHVVLGSHLWDPRRAPKPEESVQARMKRNSGLIYLSSLFHGGGANRTLNELRTSIRMSLIPGHLRQEENQYLAIPIEVVKRFPLKVQALLGYVTSPPACGVVEEQEPLFLLRD
jgi:ectoine hydroxylase-related dioxygenase (phytanoyl-CoA dioxygenase family)